MAVARTSTATALSVRTLRDFDLFVEQHTGDEIYEFLDGEMMRVPSNPWVSMITGHLFGHLFNFLRQSDRGGNLTLPDGGFMVNGQRFAPDIAWTSPRKGALSRHGYNPAAPDLAVEVLSDEENQGELETLQRKLAHYRAAGVTVWVIWPRAQQLRVYQPPAPSDSEPPVLGIDATLEGGGLLPGFRLPLRDIFRD